MRISQLCPCLALAAVLGGPGAFYAPPASASEVYCPNPGYVSLEQRLKPLMDLIASSEGDYNAINRGYAGDTPGGIQWLKGRAFDSFTVGDVLYMQRWQIFAVGRYQFIPSTLRWAVRNSSVRESDMFTPEVQDTLMAALVTGKRPAVGAYLRGEHDLVGWALDELAKEWASIEYRQGRGYYDHIGGNRAKITRLEMVEVLQNIKQAWQTAA